MSKLLVLCLIVCLAWEQAHTAEFSLAASDLAAFDPLGGLADAYVRVFYAFGVGDNFVEIGKTATVNDEANPVWTETFNVSYVPGASQRLRFNVWDEDFDGDDDMGTVEFFLVELENSQSEGLLKPLSVAENGNLIIKKL